MHGIAKCVDLGCSSFSYISKCVVFPVAKSHKLPFAVGTHKTIKMFDLIYADLWTSSAISVIDACGCQIFFLMEQISIPIRIIRFEIKIGITKLGTGNKKRKICILYYEAEKIQQSSWVDNYNDLQ